MVISPAPQAGEYRFETGTAYVKYGYSRYVGGRRVAPGSFHHLYKISFWKQPYRYWFAASIYQVYEIWSHKIPGYAKFRELIDTLRGRNTSDAFDIAWNPPWDIRQELRLHDMYAKGRIDVCEIVLAKTAWDKLRGTDEPLKKERDTTD